MLRIALTHVRTRAVAEEVVQEAWLGVLQGLDRFEGRSSLKTWILRIVANRARTRGEREARSVPLSSLGPERGGRARRGPGPLPARRSPDVPGRLVDSRRTAGRACRRRSCSPPRRCSRCAPRSPSCPPRQQEVIVLRDVEGWDAEEVSEALELSRQPARPAAPRALEGARRARALLRGRRGVTARVARSSRAGSAAASWWSSSPPIWTARWTARRPARMEAHLQLCAAVHRLRRSDPDESPHRRGRHRGARAAARTGTPSLSAFRGVQRLR